MSRIRPAVAADDESLAAIDEATWDVTVTPAPRREPGSAFFGGPQPEDVLVAEVDGTVVGYVTLHQVIPLPSHAHVLQVNGLAVAPHVQGRGIARELVQAALREATDRGARKVGLRVLSTNQPARRLYESCGFVIEGRLAGEFVLDGHPVDDLLMAWHADADADAEDGADAGGGAGRA